MFILAQLIRKKNRKPTLLYILMYLDSLPFPSTINLPSCSHEDSLYNFPFLSLLIESVSAMQPSVLLSLGTSHVQFDYGFLLEFNLEHNVCVVLEALSSR